MTSPCQQILEVLNRNLPDLDDTLRDIQHLLGLHLRHILSKACLREAVGLFGRKQFPFHCCASRSVVETSLNHFKSQCWVHPIGPAELQTWASC